MGIRSEVLYIGIDVERPRFREDGFDIEAAVP